jgi:hypothetical protein
MTKTATVNIGRASIVPIAALSTYEISMFGNLKFLIVGEK